MSYKPVTVSQLGNYIKQMIDAEELLYNISVTGEISGISNSRGVSYFTLKDQNATLSCVCFYSDKLSNFKNGDSVVVVGSAKYYIKGGKLNFNVDTIESYGESVLYKQFLELKTKLENKGYFSDMFKIPMQKQKKRIGDVTSETGAVIQDIINVRTRRNPSIDLVLYPVKVQGENAEYEIANGIKILDEYDVDAIIVARGGGSFEDLQPFNTEVVADAVFQCKKFIMSAVGHETDFTIIDFVADMRAPTPSAAAELLCVDLKSQKMTTYNKVKALFDAFDRYLLIKKSRITDNFNMIKLCTFEIVKNRDIYVRNSIKNLIKAIDLYFENLKNSLSFKKELIEKLNPSEILKLGYSVVKKQEKFISSTKDIVVGDDIYIKFKDGFVKSTVTSILE